ncbi:hypothetical protein JTB14_028519 [Gonioctena quinquepunctata]|nr:hypothetical protein JTB14_028519 [Gonioctena quinquepunctata]
MPSKRRKYDESLIEKALRELETNGSSYRKVAEKHNFQHTVSVTGYLKWQKKDFPVKRKILQSVQKLLLAVPRDNPFKHNRPDDGWFKEADIRKHLIEKDLLDVISDTSRVFNGDETGKVFAKRGSKNEDEPYEYDTKQTAKNIEGVAKEVHGIGTRKKK